VGVGDALGHLRAAISLPSLFRQAAWALCECVGFERAALFTLRDQTLVVESVCARGAPERGASVLARLRADPVRFGPGLHESEALRRRRAVLVRHAASDSRALRALPAARSYVAAPVLCQERAVGLIHVDHAPSERPVTEVDRDTLWAFAEGFGYALERGVLAERLRAQSERVLALVRSTEASVTELGRPDIELPFPSAEPTSSATPAAPDQELPKVLTRRELEVLAMLAEGETNARIAHRLVVSEGTVKTHVKHILRKLGVQNRSQAVSRYFRNHAARAERPFAAPGYRLG
jgi:LuxR family transcriptional regulator, regulator of acetate metabolism